MNNSDGDGILLVLTTCGNAEAAARLAESLVAQRLAACVSAIENIRSTYRWQDGVERATETMLVIKTTSARYAELESHIRAQSDYELPEILAVRPEGGLGEYLAWVGDATAAEEIRGETS